MQIFIMAWGVPGNSKSGNKVYEAGAVEGGGGSTGAVPIALKLYTSSHCQTNCGRCMSNVSLRNVEYGNCMCEVLPSVPVPLTPLSLPPL